MSKLVLVSCVSKKQSAPMQAADLYISEWFKKARKLVQDMDHPWFILSAEHGLLRPEKVISPYNLTLNNMDAAARRAWAERVLSQMEADLPAADEVVVLAGKRYRENLMGWLRSQFREVSVPMAGLGIGQQLNWMKNAASL